MDCRRKNNDTNYTGRAIYLHVVEVSGTPRFYVGKALKFHNRVEQHMCFRYRQKNPSLHYYALQHSQSDYFVTLSYVPDTNSCRRLGIQSAGTQTSELLMDLLETWCCLMFRSLPRKYLKEFLPMDFQLQKTNCENLNLKLPLQNSGADWNETRGILLASSDPFYQEYYFYKAQKFHHEKREMIMHRESGKEICKKLDNVPPTPGSTPSRPILLSPPSTRLKPAEGRPQRETTKQIQPSTPSSTRLTMIDLRPAGVDVSNVDKGEHKKRKWELFQDTPSNLLISRPAKSSCTDSDSDSHDLTERPVIRRLDF